jgi:hypothetical protein
MFLHLLFWTLAMSTLRYRNHNLGGRHNVSMMYNVSSDLQDA